ncbi:7339_t:CDS:2, partial [Gigaspora margarita]
MTDKARLANPNAIINTVILSDNFNDLNLLLGDGKKVHIRTGDKTIEHIRELLSAYQARFSCLCSDSDPDHSNIYLLDKRDSMNIDPLKQ